MTQRHPRTDGLDKILAAIASDAVHHDRDLVRPDTAVAALKNAGFGALRVPARFGGAGLSLPEVFRKVIALGAADPSVAHIYRNHFAVVEKLVAADTAGANVRRWLELAAGGALFSTGMTDKDDGSGAPVGGGRVTTDLDTSVVPHRITGTKYYSTGSTFADWILVRARRTDDDKTIFAFVDVLRNGVTVTDDWEGFGQRQSGSGTVTFDDVTVHPDEVVFTGSGHGEEFNNAALPQLYLTAILAGITSAVADDAVTLAKNRTRTFYHAPTENLLQDPLLQNTIGELVSQAYAASAIVVDVARTIDDIYAAESDVERRQRAVAASLNASKAKVVIDDIATRVSTALFDVGGASATSRTKDLDRHWRNARTLASHNPTAYKARIIGDHALNGTDLPTGGFF
ncbi:acyl-CoA dehydrogenase family protein [Rhodococcoides yunnanense]|uniref:acyl-CoA dehydrogenase family protein n=1 Tax=Rhodococcoides yunnanense TaxID=278209 RepID=UPI000932E48C|nr:acyl-CoA dehydrogenase family protein [Rhodococcus yunnanensis]